MNRIKILSPIHVYTTNKKKKVRKQIARLHKAFEDCKLKIVL